MTLIPQRAPRLRDQVYDALRGMIRDGTYPQHNAAEEALAALLNVSRTPVREALFQLCREGVLEDTGRGYRRPELTGHDVREIVELRRLLEPAMARAVAARATAAERTAFEAIVAREEQALDPDDSGAFVGANSDFRRLFFASCGNGRIAQTMLIFDDQIAHLRELTLGPVANRNATVEPHRRFVAALEHHDADAAEHAIRAVLEAASRYYDTIWHADA